MVIVFYWKTKKVENSKLLGVNLRKVLSNQRDTLLLILHRTADVSQNPDDLP